MKDLYDDEWSAGFIARVDLLRELDNQSITQPLYRDRADMIFTEMTARFTARLRASLGDITDPGVTLDDAIRYYVNDERGNPLLDYLSSRTRPFCDAMHISQDAYGIAAFCCAFMMWKGDLRVAYAFFSLLMRPLVSAYRYRIDAKRRGSAGGHPHHRLRPEALDLAAEYFAENPGATNADAAKHILNVLNVKYSDPPHAISVARWLKTIYGDNK
ncbi:hypothetical protein M9M37_001835 [Escherichia coli]|uniref:hypothetical protein n=1 Tax=Escherichia coli TaxID=562 RepID=UPI0010EC5C86|nr:hypothetical protein [Escherichia coli]EJF8031372.1 hypothetical protein [Escherichia coli]MDF1396559.1 hypothetical protein [Escherichia coli]GDF32058.1 hypothetical protein HmCmsJML270_00762 [Escherichia coli]HAL6342331.1 hypothetical protein [Escherichia coli]HAX4872306.1 hypothetical protein [Escherichia coli]